MTIHGQQIYFFETKDRRGVVQWFYERENELWNQTVHKRGGTVEENVEDTISSMSDSSTMFVVNVDGKLAAFFVKHQDDKGDLYMEGFHVGKEFREGGFLNEFWKIVREKFGAPFVMGIYTKNEEALRHLIKQGFELVKTISIENKEYYILKS